MVELLEVAEPYGIVTTDKKGQLTLEQVPSSTMLAERYPTQAPDTEDDEVHRNEGWFYRFLSAYAHDKLWVQTLGLTDPVSDAASDPFCLPAGANDLRFPQVRSLR